MPTASLVWLRWTRNAFLDTGYFGYCESRPVEQTESVGSAGGGHSYCDS